MSSWLSRLAQASGPRYRAIAQELVRAIEAGELPPGTRLPTQRDLALRLGISVQTVSQAYAEVERRGLVRGEVGRGTFVLAASPEIEPSFIMDRRSDDLIDLSINRPVYANLHAERARSALAALAARGDMTSMLVCRPIGGLEAHRAAGARWLEQRGLEVQPDQVLISNGAAHGLLVALAALTKPGDLVATEALVDHGIIGLAGVLGLRLESLAIDHEGIIPDAFEAACATTGIKVLCTTPTLNNPTVALMSEERRRRIAQIARRHEVFVVEDDVYGALVEPGPPPLAAVLPERTCHVTSFTKTTLSGLRIGYVAAPAALVPRLIRRIRTTSWMATPLLAELASEWIRDGTALELIRWQRAALAERQAVVAEALDGFAFTAHPAALHVWLALPEPRRAEVFVAEARLRNVAITPSEPFVVDRGPRPAAVRISIGAPRDIA
ncbi:MAG TPA: PLP-dependent aminotransferase family protein, partial [Geminicoccaceae bacterium]